MNSLSAYLDRELPGDQMLAMRSHVERCPECSVELQSLKDLKMGLCALPMCDPREGLADDILRQVRATETVSPARRLSLSMMIATSVAAAALALFAFNVFFGATSEPQLAEDGTEFNSSADHMLNSPGVGNTAPLIPVNR